MSGSQSLTDQSLTVLRSTLISAILGLADGVAPGEDHHE
jgi:hypothetical protein